MKISKRTVDQLQSTNKDQFFWDDTLKGFGIKVYKSGRKSFVVQGRLDGEVKRYTIGTYGSPWAPDSARQQALQFLAMIGDGIDPLAEKRLRLKIPKLQVVAAQYQIDGNLHKKPSTRELESRCIIRHIIPLLGKKRISEISKGDVKKFLANIANGKTSADIKTKARGLARVRGGKGAANRSVAVLSAIFVYAKENGIYDENPTIGMPLYKLKEHVRYLTDSELEWLGEALVQAEDEYVSLFAIAAIRFILFTGCRRDEALLLRWDSVDIEQKLIYLPDSKVGQRPLYFGQVVAEMLMKLPRVEGSPLVFPSSVGGETKISIQKVWDKIRTRAGLEDVRINDLRHNFASATVSSGESLYITSKLLGHKNQRTTERYAHMAPDPVKNATDLISSRFLKIIDKKR